MITPKAEEADEFFSFGSFDWEKLRGWGCSIVLCFVFVLDWAENRTIHVRALSELALCMHFGPVTEITRVNILKLNFLSSHDLIVQLSIVKIQQAHKVLFDRISMLTELL